MKFYYTFSRPRRAAWTTVEIYAIKDSTAPMLEHICSHRFQHGTSAGIGREVIVAGGTALQLTTFSGCEALEISPKL